MRWKYFSFCFIKGLRKKVILVDHNERGQSIPGIEEADILEIVDHHRVADIQTIGPLLFRGEPLGSTATIVTKIFDENDVEIPQSIAGALLGAIISDTLLFKSPTCTPVDTKAARKLAKIAGVDIEEFAMEMFKAGTSLVGKTVEEIFNQDFKNSHLNKELLVLDKLIQWILKDLCHIKQICLTIWTNLQKTTV